MFTKEGKKLRPLLKLLLPLLVIIFSSCTTPETTIKDSDRAGAMLTGVFHPVKKGQTFWGIAHAYNVTMEDLIEVNDLDPRDPIHPGDYLFIPGAAHILQINVVKKSSDPVKTVKKPIKNIKKVKKLPLPPKYHHKLIWPTKGVVVLRFGRSGLFQNDGIDLAAPEATPVYTVLDGKIIYSGSQKGYGNIVIIQHAEKIVTIYAYNQKNLLKAGTAVKAGDEIARVGHSGKAGFNKLHFEIRKGVKPINPLPYLKID